MTVVLDARAERIVEQQLHDGRYRTPADVVLRALENLSAEKPKPTRSVAEVVAHMRQARKHRSLAGLKVKDLVNEGRKH